MPQVRTPNAFMVRLKEIGCGRAQQPVAHPLVIIHRVCCLAGSTSLIEDVRTQNPALATAIRNRDTPRLFNWLIDALSYQGISDQVAAAYIARHGQVT